MSNLEWLLQRVLVLRARWQVAEAKVVIAKERAASARLDLDEAQLKLDAAVEAAKKSRA